MAGCIHVTAPLVIGHRGASGHLPEHTLAAYELAVRLGADYIEPDLVCTADGVLVARHEPEIGATTDIAVRPEFARRRTVKLIDGVVRHGWFVDDLTLVELRTLRARERLPRLRTASAAHDGRHPVATFAEVLALRARLTGELGRTVGVYAELKHPTRSAGLGLPLLPPLVAALRAAGLDRPDAPVVVESFEIEPLRELRGMVSVPISQLVAPAGHPAARTVRTAELCAPSGLARIARYASGVGAHKDLVLPRDRAGGLGAPTRLVADAHDAGLAVHCWTFRDENRFLPRPLRGDAAAEYAAFFAAGVDGVFSDHPDTAVTARAHWTSAA